MAVGVVGKKCGMTQIFSKDGVVTPVTVIEVKPNRITQIKTIETDGYTAVQVTTGEVNPNRINKPEAGHFTKANVQAGKGLWEFRVDEDMMKEYSVGAVISVDTFQEGQLIDVVGITKGKGFAGVIKRHNFATQDASHGNSVSHRVPGSIGQNQTPGRVFKGKKMAGHMGNVRQTVQNQRIVMIDKERNLLLVKGSIPGAKQGDVIIQNATKGRRGNEENQ